MSVAKLINVNTNDIINNKAKVLRLTSLDDIVLKIDPKFDKAAWHIEPTQTISELHHQRANQIRQSYDYVVLYFSGGADSITVLNSFVNNNIPIDELVVYVNSDAKHNTAISGIVALNYLSEIKYQGKVTLFDINFDVLNKIVSSSAWKTYENFSGLMHSFYRFRIGFFETHKYLTKVTARKGKVAHVFGGIFPKIERLEDGLYSSIHINSFMVSSTDPQNVQFFTCAEMPELHIKHSYILSRSYNEALKKESREYKLLIRDSYSEELDIPKNEGRTDSNENQFGHHHMLYRLYEKKPEFITRYDKILDYFNETQLIDLSGFKKLYKLSV